MSSHLIQTNRRRFVQGFGASVAGFAVWPRGLRAYAGYAPNDAITIAGVGVGGKGSSDIDQAGNHGHVLAICDIDENRLNAKGEKFKDAAKFVDYRELLSKLGDKLDAVVVSTPDHTHAPASIMAMRMGKHVYCQKPLTHSVWEARMMRQIAREKNVCTQMGNQGTADGGLRRGAEIVQSVGIGEVKEVYVWTNRPFKYWKQSPDIVARPKETPPVPKHVHWDLFLGPAPVRPYHPVYHPHDWRGWWDFGTGSLGDMACHTANLVFKSLKLELPVRVSAEHAELNSETFPAWAVITYEFPARGDLPPVKLHWYEGARDGKRNLPPESLFPPGFKPSDSGSLMIGSKGQMYSPSDYGSQQSLWPEEKFKDYKAPTPFLPRIEGGKGNDDSQKKEWVEAIRAGKPAHSQSNFEYSSRLTESMILGNVAIRVNKAIDYDPATGKVTNTPDAAKFIQPDMRDGWKI